MVFLSQVVVIPVQIPLGGHVVFSFLLSMPSFSTVSMTLSQEWQRAYRVLFPSNIKSSIVFSINIS